MAGKIFINYRRGDDPGNTGRLFDRLQEAFQPDQLFIDVDSIAPGLDFVRVLEEQVGQCDALLAVIGKGWIDARDDTGGRRLDNPEDFVRIEIESALKQDKRVIPVLVGDTHMPRPEELPEAIRPLARRNAVRLSYERFRADAQGLIKALQRALEEVETLRQAQAEAARQAHAEAERKRQEDAANARAQAQREAEEQARRDKEQARLTAIAGLSADQIGKAEELANWDFIKSSESAQEFRDHLARFPHGVTERMARAGLESLMWAGLSGRPDLPGLRSFLNEFPDGKRAADAKAQLADLERQAAAAREEEERRREEKLQENARQRAEEERRREEAATKRRLDEAEAQKRQQDEGGRGQARAQSGDRALQAQIATEAETQPDRKWGRAKGLWLIVGVISIAGLAGYYQASRQSTREPASAQQLAPANTPLEKAADNGDMSAMFNLGLRYADGQGVAQDYAKAREWYERAAAKGDPRAMSSLGWLYESGQGVTQDYAKAREWFEKAADKGDANAMRGLGWRYESGQGVARDYAKAREWYEKAAAKGDPRAMYSLGGLYESGQGVAQDYAKAREWYEKAADKGDASATAALERLRQRPAARPRR
jgi:TPR repeat protein